VDEVPADILARVGDDALPAVRRWWTDLSAADRQAAVVAWDDEARDRFFAPLADDTLEQLPVVIGGRFVPAEQSQLVGPEWHADYFEYLLKYPELLLCELPYYPVMGVCTAHPEARAVLAAGCIPAGFVCPLSSVECPMRQLLAKTPNQIACCQGAFFDQLGSNGARFLSTP
jgi:hypothetical protein